MQMEMTRKRRQQYSYQKKQTLKQVHKERKEGHYIKGQIQEGDIILINIYAPNVGGPKYIKLILTDIKEEIDRNTIIVGDINTPLTSIDR